MSGHERKDERGKNESKARSLSNLTSFRSRLRSIWVRSGVGAGVRVRKRSLVICYRWEGMSEWPERKCRDPLPSDEVLFVTLNGSIHKVKKIVFPTLPPTHLDTWNSSLKKFSSDFILIQVSKNKTYKIIQLKFIFEKSHIFGPFRMSTASLSSDNCVYVMIEFDGRIWLVKLNGIAFIDFKSFPCFKNKGISGIKSRIRSWSKKFSIKIFYKLWNKYVFTGHNIPET